MASSAITVTSTLTVGGLALLDNYNSQLASIDSSLSEVRALATANSQDPLTAAVVAAAATKTEVAVVLLDTDGRMSTIAGEDTLVASVPTTDQINAGRLSAASISAVRMRSLLLADGSTLLFAVDLNQLNQAQQSNLRLLGAAVLVALITAIGATSLMLRRDIRGIEKLAKAASAIAKGDSIDVPDTKDKSEVGALTHSIAGMVKSLRDAIEKRDRSQQAIQRFIGDASHELRTPLTVIRGYSELLAKTKTDAKTQKKALERIGSEVMRMENLVNDLLTVAELRESRNIKKAKVDFSALVSEAISDFKVMQPQRKITSSISKGVTVTGSEEHLAQLLNNVFSNIRRHTPLAAKVRVQLTQTSKVISLLVDDAGPGLSADLYARGIEDFDRFDPFAKRSDGGSGLGMTILRAIAAEHGGSVVLRPSPLKGLQVQVTLAKNGKPKATSS